MSVDITSRPYIIGAACEKCVFGSGEHAEWCLDYSKNFPETEQGDLDLIESLQRIRSRIALRGMVSG